MSKEQGIKRLLSPESNISAEDKRRRNNSLEIVEDTPTKSVTMEPETTLSDIRLLINTLSARLDNTAKTEDLLNLATKQDLKTIDDRITAQGQEITQLRTEVQNLQSNFNTLQANVDGQFAASLAGGERSVGHGPGREPGRTTTNMADRISNNPQSEQSRRKNLVFEGLKGDTEMEMMASVIDVASAIGVKVYREEIVQVIRMSRRDPGNSKPGPVLVSLSRIVLRDSILKHKRDLYKCAGFDGVFVNADESIEVRRAKSFIRKASFNARKRAYASQVPQPTYPTWRMSVLPQETKHLSRTSNATNGKKPLTTMTKSWPRKLKVQEIHMK